MAVWALAAWGVLATSGEVTAFERVGAITLEGDEHRAFSAVIDPTGAFAYFGDDGVPAKVVKIGLLPRAPELSFDPQSLDFGGGGNYCPDDPVSRGQMAVLLTKTFGLTLYGP